MISLGLASLNNSSGFKGYRGGLLLPGTWPWDELGQGKFVLVCENCLRKRVGGLSPGSAGLHR